MAFQNLFSAKDIRMLKISFSGNSKELRKLLKALLDYYGENYPVLKLCI
jgi:hypothetical protein